MADPEAPNGQRARDREVAILLGVCVMAICLLAGMSFFKAPSQWDLVREVLSLLHDLTLMLVGGLLGTTLPRKV